MQRKLHGAVSEKGSELMDQEAEKMELAGTVDAVLFSNEENGYTILRLDTDDGRQLRERIGELEQLLDAYRKGLIVEQVK